MAGAKLEIAKALIRAAVPTLIMEAIRELKRPKYDSLEAMQDCVDWDAEYETLLKEVGYKVPKKQKASKKMKKARK